MFPPPLPPFSKRDILFLLCLSLRVILCTKFYIQLGHDMLMCTLPGIHIQLNFLGVISLWTLEWKETYINVLFYRQKKYIIVYPSVCPTNCTGTKYCSDTWICGCQLNMWLVNVSFVHRVFLCVNIIRATCSKWKYNNIWTWVWQKHKSHENSSSSNGYS